MFAIIKTGGKQYTVSEGSILYVEKLDKEEGSTITFDEILAFGGKIGNPTVANVKVTALVEKHGKAPKIIVRKFKKKKGYNKVQGHRQAYTKLVIQSLIRGEN